MAVGSKAVFVGNIPFNLSEEQIIAILSTAGQVVKFRLMTNSDTGKPKGFGFADYADADSAASAVRNLNDYEVQGRKIRVDWPHNQEKNDATSSTSLPQNSTLPDPVPNGQFQSDTFPSIPPGVDLPANIKASDAISQTLSNMPPQQLLDVLTQMKSLAISEPAKATELLRREPRLSYAIFQALILMNLVDTKILTQVIEQPPPGQVPMPAPIQPPPMIPPPQQYSQYTPQAYPGYPPPVPGHQMPGMPLRPPQPYGMPAPTPQPAPQPAQEQDAQKMLQQVLAMDQRTIDGLPPDQRAQVMLIRQQMGVR